MATVSRLSAQQTNRDASPRILNNGGGAGGYARAAGGGCNIATGDNSPSKYNFFQLPSNAVLSSLRVFWNGTGGTTTAFHLGLYSTTEQGGGVIDEDLFATAINLASAVNGTDIVCEAGVSGTTSGLVLEKPLWERLGLSADPQTFYDVKAVLSAVADNAGQLGIGAIFSSGN